MSNLSSSAKHVFPINLGKFLISFVVKVPIISVFITPTLSISKVCVVKSKTVYKSNSYYMLNEIIVERDLIKFNTSIIGSITWN